MAQTKCALVGGSDARACQSPRQRLLGGSPHSLLPVKLPICVKCSENLRGSVKSRVTVRSVTRNVSFDHLVGGYEHGVRHDQRERLGGLAIDDHHELGWLHDGQVGRLLAF